MHVHKLEKDHVSGLQKGFDSTCAWVTDDEVMPKPHRSWRAKDYAVQRVEPSDVNELLHGDTIALGDRTLEVK